MDREHGGETAARLPGPLLKAQRFLRNSVAGAGNPISNVLGTDDTIPLDDIFVNLTLLSREDQRDLFTVHDFFSSRSGEDRQQSAFAAASQSLAGATQRRLQLDDLFKANAASHANGSVLVFGSAGIGKTTVFLEMLVRLWCMGRLWPDVFDLVVGTELRVPEVQAATSLSELLAVKLSSLNLEEGELLEIERYFLANPSRLCLVLDGLDECSFASCSRFMRELLLRKGLKGSRVMVTSRPCPDSYKLSQHRRYPRQVQVLGLSPENVDEYVGRVVGGARAETMLGKLRETPQVYALMSTPMFAAVACELFVSGKGVAKCSTGLYESVLLRVVERAGGGACKSFEDGEPKYVQALCELGRFAFRMLVIKKLVFAESDLKSSELSEEACHLGLLLACKCSNSTEVRQYRFSHLSLQEFLAAWYMARCVVKEERHCTGLVGRAGVYSGHMTIFWRFLIALLPPKVSSAVTELLWQDMGRADNDTATSEGSDDGQLAKEVATSVECQPALYPPPGVHEAATKSKEEGVAAQHGLLQLLVAFQEHSVHQGVVCDGHCPLVHSLFAAGIELSEYHPGTALSVSECSAVRFLLAHHRCVGRDRIGLSGLVMGVVGFAGVSAALQQCRNVRILNVACVGCSDADLLVSAITALAIGLEEVDVSGNHVGVPGFRALCGALGECEGVRSIGLSAMQASGAPMSALSELLQRCGRLRALHVHWNVYAFRGAEENGFVRAVRVHGALRALSVCKAGFRERVVSRLCLLPADPECELVRLYLCGATTAA